MTRFSNLEYQDSEDQSNQSGLLPELRPEPRKLEDEGRIPVLPVFIDSPMAIDVTDIYCRHREEHDLDMEKLMKEGPCPLSSREFHVLRSAAESKSLNERQLIDVLITVGAYRSGSMLINTGGVQLDANMADFRFPESMRQP